MKLGLFLGAILLAGCCVVHAQSADKSKPHARACVAVMNSISGEEEAFQASSTAGKGKRIVAHIDASAKCEVVVAAFNRKDGQLAHGWPPQYVQVTSRNEVALPKAPVTWSWEKDAGPVELYVLVFAPGSKDCGELKTLVGAMQNAKSEAIAKLQTNKLHELIGRARIDKSSAAQVAKPDTTEVGGVFRMVVGFEWRDSARTVNFTTEKPGALIFPGISAK